MADRWYLKGIHVPVNRFGSEENKKRESPTNRTARVSNRHSFSPSGEKIKGGNLKGHPYFFEAKVAVPHRGARLGPAGRLGKNHPHAPRSGIFSCRALTPFRRENGCKAYKETRVPAPQAGCLTDKNQRIWQQKT